MPPFQNDVDSPNPKLDGATGRGPGDVEQPTQDTPRVVYIDPEDDLPVLLDRVEEAPTPAILVLPDNCRSVHGIVAARLLMRRAQAAGIDIAAVASDRATVSQLQNAGIPCAATVGEARKVLAESLGTRLGLFSAARHRLLPAEARTTRLPSGSLALDAGQDDAVDVPLDDDAPDGATRVSTAGDGLRAPKRVNGSPDTRGSQTPDVDVESDFDTDDDGPGEGGALIARWEHRRRWPFAVALVLLLVLGAGFAWITLLPFATVSIVYTPQAFNETYQATVGSTKLDDVPLYTTHVEQTISMEIAGTGTTLVPDGRASGTIALANPLAGVVSVPAGTVLSTADGLRFDTTASVDVPSAVRSFSGTTNGQATAPIVALAAGAASNVAASTITVVEGRLAGVLLVTNASALTGGTMKTEYSVTAQNRASAERHIRDQLTAAETAALNEKYAQSPLRTIESPYQTGGSETQTTRDGRPYLLVTITMRTDMAYLHGDDVHNTGLRFARATLAHSGQVLIESAADVKVLQAQGTIPAQIALRVQGQTKPALDLSSLAALIAGKSVTDAAATLDMLGKRGGWHAEVKTDPDWSKRLPITSRLITIRMVE
jgi:hypothetical protein